VNNKGAFKGNELSPEICERCLGGGGISSKMCKERLREAKPLFQSLPLPYQGRGIKGVGHLIKT